MITRLKSLFTTETYHDNTSHRYLVVPDLHGIHSIYKQVEHFIKNHCEKDRTIIFLGDYMDRGEAGEAYGQTFEDVGSYRIIRDLITLKAWAKKEERELIFLRGNHEIFYEDYYLHHKKYAYEEFGFFKRSADCFNHVMQEDIQFHTDFLNFLKALQPYYLDKKYAYLFIHAGIDPAEKDLQKQVDSGLIYWIRDQFLFSEKKLPYTVIFGHTPFSKPFMRADKIGLDSGVYKRDFLNLLTIDDKDSKIIQLHKQN